MKFGSKIMDSDPRHWIKISNDKVFTMSDNDDTNYSKIKARNIKDKVGQ